MACETSSTGSSSGMTITDTAVTTSIETVTTTGVAGFSTYRIKLHLASLAVNACKSPFYKLRVLLWVHFPPACDLWLQFDRLLVITDTLYGLDSQRLGFPAAYQCTTPFGVDLSGTNPAFWAVANTDATGYAQYDSWLSKYTHAILPLLVIDGAISRDCWWL